MVPAPIVAGGDDFHRAVCLTIAEAVHRAHGPGTRPCESISAVPRAVILPMTLPPPVSEPSPHKAETSRAPADATLPAIFAVFFRIGLFSFGGGLSGWMYREVVVARPWLTDAEFLSGMAVGQILPGANVANLSVYIGQRLRGLPGAATAVFALLVGPFFAVLGLAAVYDQLKVMRWAERGLDGVAAAAIGLILIIVLKGAKQASRDVISAVAMLATFAAVGVMGWPMLEVVAVVGPVSVAIAWYRSRPDA